MQNLTIDSLPDIALLEVFDHYRLTEECRGGFNWMWWYTLAHVCHRWRQVILASPERLSLRYLITHGSPVTDILRHQPRLPLVLEYWDQDTVDDEEDIDPAPWSSDSVEGITLALVHLDRIRHIAMQCGSGDLMHTILEMLARPARQLEILSITSLNQVTSPLSTLLGGHAPALRLLTLECVLVPLPSAPLLSQLTLVIGCDEVDAFAVDKILEGIHAMSQLRYLALAFYPAEVNMINADRVIPLSGTHTSLTLLSQLSFHGPCFFFECLASKIDAPNLSNLHVRFGDCLAVSVPSFSRFICSISKPSVPTVSILEISRNIARIDIFPDSLQGLNMHISLHSSAWDHGFDPLVASVSTVCRSLAPVLSLADRLEIRNDDIPSLRPEDGAYRAGYATEWRSIIASFAGVVKLQLEHVFTLALVQALQEPGGQVLLPNLQEFELFSQDRLGRRSLRRIPEEFEPLFAPRQSPASPNTT